MIDDDAVAGRETPAAGAGLLDLAGRFVSGDDALVALGALAQVLVVNAADIRPADGRRLHAEENFAMARLGYGRFPEFRRAISR